MAIGFKGTSVTDIEEGATDALETDISQMSPASNSVAANLDGGVDTGTDWSTKNAKWATFDRNVSGGTYDLISISGSGIVTFGFWWHEQTSSDRTLIYQSDGGDILPLTTDSIFTDDSAESRSTSFTSAFRTGPVRWSFDSSFTLFYDNNAGTGRVIGGLQYVLD